MIEPAVFVARRLVLAAALAGGGLAAFACQGPEAFYREDMGAGNGGTTGAAGVGPAGTAGTNGSAGTAAISGAAGTSATGTAGTSATGAAGTSAAAGTSGSAGTSGTGRGGTTGAAGTTGSGGRGGATGAAGTTGTAGTTGSGGRGGATGAAGTTGSGGRGGTTGTAGATGSGGRGGTTGSGGAAPCTGCMPQVLQKCQQDTSMQAVSTTIKIINMGNATIAWSDVTVRYWFSHMNVANPVLEIDYSQVIPKAAITARFTADYLEIGFTSMAGTLYAFDTTAGSGEIQLRFHAADYSNWNPSQTDDYSYQACAGSALNPWMKTTAYIRGTLVWGTEPP
jgi:hypothetical protein